MRSAFLILFAGFIYCSCNSQANHVTAITAEPEKQAIEVQYDLNKPVRTWELPSELLEISGNFLISKDQMLAIEDLHPNLYLLNLRNDKAAIDRVIPFQKTDKQKFDIEDVAVNGKTVYALWSHGVIYEIDDWSNPKKVTPLETGLDKKNNTEGLTFDPVTHNLLIACKNNAGMEEEKKSDRAVYEFDLSKRKLIDDPFLVIEKKEIKQLIGEKVDFYPSAIAVHPLTHDIYVLSTRGNKCLVQYSHDGKIKGFQFIDKNLMLQPEGICFSPDGDLYISTEGKNGEPAHLFLFTAKRS